MTTCLLVDASLSSEAAAGEGARAGDLFVSIASSLSSYFYSLDSIYFHLLAGIVKCPQVVILGLVLADPDGP